MESHDYNLWEGIETATLAGKNMNRSLSILFFCFLFSTAFSQEAGKVKFQPKVKFSNYQAIIYRGAIAKLELKNPEHRRFRTALRNGYKSGINFAGHYCLVYWGCGSPCQSGAIIDVTNGQVYDIPSAAVGYNFKKNSRMLIVNPPDSNSYYDRDVIYAIPEIYILNDSTKKFSCLRDL